MAMPVLSDDIKRFDLSGEHEVNLRRLAREIGIGIIDRETIFKNHGITTDIWLQIATNPQFQKLLAEECERWSATLNTRERVDIKTLAMIEEALPAMYANLHDPRFGDAAKVALFTALQRGVGIGLRGADGAGTMPGEKVSITINLGEDKKLTVEHQMPTITLEGNVTDDAA